MNSKIYIGCCGAYCKTCKALSNDACKGCKLGYDSGKRDINKSRCKIKLCCFRDNGFETCADCTQLETCKIIGDWFAKNGYKYKKYQQAIRFIKENGYKSFIKIANRWSNAYGKYE